MTALTVKPGQLIPAFGQQPNDELRIAMSCISSFLRHQARQSAPDQVAALATEWGKVQARLEALV